MAKRSVKLARESSDVPEIPSRVRIVGKIYAVEVVEPDKRDISHGTAAGNISNERCRIFVNGDFHPDQIRDTLLHEVIHGCEEVLGTNAPEEYVHGLSTTLLSVLKDNPEFTEYLLKSEE